MIAPLASQDPAGAKTFEDRFARLRTSLASSGEEPVPGSLINAITIADRGDGTDSLHRAGNGPPQSHQRPAGTARKRGYRWCTRVLSSPTPTAGWCVPSWPGSTARPPSNSVTWALQQSQPRSGDKLVIQNDIGLTDAHVLVVTVKDQTITITYTDIHLPRLHFFQSLFSSFPVQWSDTISRTPEKKSRPRYTISLSEPLLPAMKRIPGISLLIPAQGSFF